LFCTTKEIMGTGPSKPPKDEADRLREGLNDVCLKAAHAIDDADVLLVVTGAGFSADSGLAVYNDIARIKPYADRMLKYHDLCEPHWLQTDRELFYGFWGACFDDYRQTQPHEGYEIISRWRDRINQKPAAAAVRKQIKSEDNTAGAFFMFTSNVDAHSFDYFAAEEIRECHGNIETWQCAQQGACSAPGDLWRAPEDYCFNVDKTTMLADLSRTTRGAVCSRVKELSTDSSVSMPALRSSADGDKKDDHCRSHTAAHRMRHQVGQQPKPKIGHTLTHTGQRKHTLRYMPVRRNSSSASSAGGASSGDSDSDSDNLQCFPPQAWPRCPHCNGTARPAILMFGDTEWVDDDEQEQRFEKWSEAVQEICNSQSQRAGRQDADTGIEEMRFDPETGAPIGGAIKKQWKSDAPMFDPETGLPIGGRQDAGRQDDGEQDDGEQDDAEHKFDAALSESSSGIDSASANREGSSDAVLSQSSDVVPPKSIFLPGADVQEVPLKVVIVEIGCGANVTTCRNQSEFTLKCLGMFAETTLVRINPEFPLADNDRHKGHVVPIMSRGLVALQKIDRLISVKGAK
jgi:NAD-dependent SIR2 family protein deacetylase